LSSGGVANTIVERNGSNDYVFASGAFHAKSDLVGITIPEYGNAPASPTADTEARIYVFDNKFIIQWNDGGTTRYKYLDLTGTGTTWTHSTTAP
jgi:hypothetical protein